MTPHALVARPPSAALVPAGSARPDDEAVQEAEQAPQRSAWTSIRRRWRTLLAATAVGVAGAGAYLAMATPQYEAVATLRVRRPALARTGAAGRPTDGDGGLPGAEIELLRSRVLAAEVVDSLGLRLQVDRPAARARRQLLTDVRVAPGEEAVGYVLRRDGAGFTVAAAGAEEALGTLAVGRPAQFGPVTLTLGPAAGGETEIRLHLTPWSAAVDGVQRGLRADAAQDGAGVVALRYRDTDPERAADVLGAVVARHLGRRRDAQSATAKSVAASLRARLDTVRQARVASEQAVRAFREQEHMVDTREEAAAQVRQTVDLEAQRAAMDGERQALTALLSIVQRDRGSPEDYRNLLTYPTLLRTQAATDLLRQLGDLEVQRDALARPTPGAPDGLALLVREREIGRQVRVFVRTYLAGLRRQAVSVDHQLARVMAELARIPGREAELARLQRAPESLGQLETALLKQVEASQLSNAAAEPGVDIVDPASAAARPVSPRPAPLLGLGLLTGLMAGSGLAIGRDRRDRSVRSRADLQVAAGLPVLAAVPVISAGGAGSTAPSGGQGLRAGVRRLVRGDDARPASASPSDVMGEIIDTIDPVLDDAYARLYLNVLQRTHSQARSILVASPLPGEGRTTTALGLATTLARRGMRVLLIDGDLRRGTLAQDYFGLSPNATGLAELLRGTVTLKSALRVVRLDERASVTYMASGRGPERAAVILDAAAMRELFTQVTTLFEAVVVDSPPLNLVTDGALLATLSDAVILVGRTGVTDTAALSEAAQLLRGLGARVVGTLLNGVDPRRDAAMRESREYHRLVAAQRLQTLAASAAAEVPGASAVEGEDRSQEAPAVAPRGTQRTTAGAAWVDDGSPGGGAAASVPPAPFSSGDPLTLDSTATGATVSTPRRRAADTARRRGTPARRARDGAHLHAVDGEASNGAPEDGANNPVRDLSGDLAADPTEPRAHDPGQSAPGVGDTAAIGTPSER